MEEKAQVNLEYLLIVVGGIVIVTVASILIKNAANSVNQAIEEKAGVNANN